MTRPQPPLPTFLIIGAQKSATRWLRFNLGRHPSIFTVPRECAFFNDGKRFSRGVDSYRAQFAAWSGEPIVGEATPGYLMSRHQPATVAARIHQVIPRVRLVAILRNPIDRAYSAMIHQITRRRLAADSNLLDLVRGTPPPHERFGLVAGGQYAAALEPYHELFGDQLLVLLHDDVRSAPRRVYEQALRHIGAPDDFVPPELDQVVFSNQPPSEAQRSLSPEDRWQLYSYFRDDVRRLETMLGRDLSAWDPDPLPPGVAVSLLTDPFPEHYDRALAWVDGLLRGVSQDQLARPTPCAEWDVSELLDHLVRGMHSYAASLRRHALPGTPNGQLAGDPVQAFSSAAETMRAALRTPDCLRGKVTPPRGPKVAATFYARFALVEQLAHGWDLATATGQDATIPAGLLHEADSCARFLATFASAAFKLDPPVSVRRSANPTERFVARLGRDPTWTKPPLGWRVRRALTRRSMSTD